MVAEVEVGVRTPNVGAPGTLDNVACVVAAIDCPTLLWARTATDNADPRCRFDTEHDVESGVASVHVPALVVTL